VRRSAALRRSLAADLCALLTPFATVALGRRIVVRWQTGTLTLTDAEAQDLLVWLPPVASPRSLRILEERCPHPRARIVRALQRLRR